MKAFHTFRPRKDRFGDFKLDRFEIFTLLISALEWKKFNGEIKLVTDSFGRNYLKSLGILDAWDEIETSLDALDSLNVNEEIFWAGSKIFALHLQKSPIVMIDLDFICWRKIDFSRFGKNVAVIHREDVNNFVYPPREYFSMHEGFEFPKNLDWNERACNTAFAYFGSKDLIDRYFEFALKFMQSVTIDHADLPYMVFAEQRWLAMCAKSMGLKIFEFSALEDLFSDQQKYFTHVWGFKESLRNDSTLEKKFCDDCLARLKFDFPEFFDRMEFLK